MPSTRKKQTDVATMDTVTWLSSAWQNLLVSSKPLWHGMCCPFSCVPFAAVCAASLSEPGTAASAAAFSSSTRCVLSPYTGSTRTSSSISQNFLLRSAEIFTLPSLSFCRYSFISLMRALLLPIVQRTSLQLP